MRIIGLEEHFATEDVLAVNRLLAPADRDLAFHETTEGETSRRLFEIGPERLAAMDNTGLDVQVLSLTTPGVQNLDGHEAVDLAYRSNDLLAEAVAAHPDRFQGLATLPTSSPAQAVAELERSTSLLHLDGAMIFGRTGDKNMDHPSFWPLYEAAAALRVPLHLHPQSPPKSVRTAYYSGFDPTIDTEFATIGMGWHYDAGVQILRMIVSGVFDRFPGLQVITGHWGEMIVFYLDRIQHLATVARLPRPLVDYFRTNLYVTPSGIASERYLRWAIEVVGADRILFSTDYPFTDASLSGAREFLSTAPISESDRNLIASENWSSLRAQIVR